MAAEKLELVKVVCQTVTAVRENGKIVREIDGEKVHCYTPEQAAGVFAQAEEEIKAQNALNGNRQQRRARKPKDPA